MSARDQINVIRIVRITKDGIEAGFSSLGHKISQISPRGFVAVDCEFSGFSRGKKYTDLKDRYAALRMMAHTRAVFQVGIAIFDVKDKDINMNANSESTNDGTSISQLPPVTDYEVSVYELLLSCQDDFVMSADAGKFLVAHNFDFNDMFTKGIPYERAATDVNKLESETKDGIPWRWGKLPRGLLWRIGRQGVPVVLHNGLLDLAFLFAAFQGPLPESLPDFITNLLDCIPAGYWDTKLISTNSGENTNFLAFLFAKCVSDGKLSVTNAPKLPEEDETDPSEATQFPTNEALCALYAFRGFCHRGASCPFDHDPFRAVEDLKKGKAAKDSKEASKRSNVQSRKLKKARKALALQSSAVGKKEKKKPRARRESQLLHDLNISGNVEVESNSSSTCSKDSAKSTPPDSSSERRRNHAAGWDAFCTGYIFASYRISEGLEKLESVHNKIALPSKDSSLVLCKSKYADLDKIGKNSVDNAKAE